MFSVLFLFRFVKPYVRGVVRNCSNARYVFTDVDDHDDLSVSPRPPVSFHPISSPPSRVASLYVVAVVAASRRRRHRRCGE